MIDKNKIGKNLYELRKKSGITQDSLAKILNITPQAISKWENGITIPDTYLLPVLSQLYNLPIEALLCVKSYSDRVQDNNSSKVLLPGLKLYTGAPSLISCIKSSLHYIGICVSLGWISAPYAFMLNINDSVSSKGTEFWNDRGCFLSHVGNCGGIIETQTGWKGEKDISEKRNTAWTSIRNAINKGLPCYVWELDKPQYYLIAGYDDIGYYYFDIDSGNIAGPFPYEDLGNSEWGILEIHIIHPGSISDNLKSLKDIFEYAITVGNPELYPPNDGYTMGIEAYSVWWNAIANNTADYYGCAYNAAFWSHCKSMAVSFLLEAKLRIGIMEELFDEAIRCYQSCARSLKKLTEVYPLMNGASDITKKHKDEAIHLLQISYRQEQSGLNNIKNILDEIYKLW